MPDTGPVGGHLSDREGSTRMDLALAALEGVLPRMSEPCCADLAARSPFLLSETKRTCPPHSSLLEPA